MGKTASLLFLSVTDKSDWLKHLSRERERGGKISVLKGIEKRPETNQVVDVTAP